MLKKVKKLPTYLKILFTILLSILWIAIATNFNIKTRTNWMISGIVIAGISSIFFGFNTKHAKNKNETEEKQ